MRSQQVVDRVRELGKSGLSANRIAAGTGIPRSTVGRWLRHESRITPGSPPPAGPSPDDWDSYAYLLGLYLGDGWIGTRRTSRRLELTLDSRYSGIIRAACDAISAIYPTAKPRVRKRRGANCVDVIANGKHWPALLPQHGPGKKHGRRIGLLMWQRLITREHPAALIRGLIHSDGCRCQATIRRRGRTYTYGRYYFKNRSQDILGIFTEHLTALGIEWTRSSWDTIQVAQSRAVEGLDGLVGPKG